MRQPIVLSRQILHKTRTLPKIQDFYTTDVCYFWVFMHGINNHWTFMIIVYENCMLSMDATTVQAATFGKNKILFLSLF
jgi:hypothetical protein